jgi:uncharacterized membrane protein YagU involved in acid resistance
LLSGLVANVLEMLYGFATREQWEAFMKSANMQMRPASMVAHLVWSFVVGIAAIWLYAAIRPRYGPGPATAARAGLAVWLFVHATFALATVALGFFPAWLMAIGAAWALVETILATLAGAAVYREP